MGSERDRKLDEIRKFERLLEKQTGKAVRPYRADSYVNLLNRYGTSKDTTEHYRFQQEPPVPDDILTAYYEGNGLFAKIIDTPAEEAIKHGFEMTVKDQEIQDFYKGALDELDWEETAMTAIKWARLFGGSIVVMLINDGRGLDEPVDWKNIRSIDDLRVYDRSVIQEDTSSMFAYRPDDPFRTRSSRLGMPEYYDVFSRYGHFRVHDSRCLVFQNGLLPENTTNSIYQMWGIPEYIRINRAIRDAEVAHGSAIKLLDRSIQAVYKMKDLAAELATEEGEDRVLRRLQTIDMARGLLNSITIDAEGEDYDFRTFQFTGVSDVVDSACNYLSALTSIPQTILFGRSPAGMNSTGESDLENWYNYLERIQSRMVKKNLRYLLSIIFQAGVACGEVDEVPEISIEFNPLWSMSESEQAAIDQQKAQTQQVRAQTAQIYMDAQVIDPSEVRRKLADSDEFDIENMLDEIDEEDLFANMPQGGDDDDMLMGGGNAAHSGMPGNPSQAGPAPQENPPAENATEEQGKIPEEGDLADYAEGVDVEEHNTDPGTEGSAPTAAPAATKLPEDMSEEEKEKAAEKKDSRSDEGNSNSGNHGHEGRPGKIGGSSPSSSGLNSKVSSAYKSGKYSEVGKSIRSALKDMPSGSAVTSKGVTYRKVDDDNFEYEVNGTKAMTNANYIANSADLFNEANAPTFEVASSSETAEQMVRNGELDPAKTSVETPAAEAPASLKSFRDMTEEEKDSYVKQVKERTEDIAHLEQSATNGSLANELANEFCSAPTVMDDEEFERYCKENGATKIYRGTEDYWDQASGEFIRSADDITEEFANGEQAAMGGGNYGNGWHFSDMKSTARGYVGNDYSDEDEEMGGTLWECALKPDAKVVDLDTANRESRKSPYNHDSSAWALAHGYDAIAGVSDDGSRGHTLSVVNRGALVMKKSVERYKNGQRVDSNSPKATKTDANDADNNLSTSRPKHGSVGVLVVEDGCILSGIRKSGFAPGLVCGPGGHVEDGETHEQAAIRETQEEFGITPKGLIQIGLGPWEPDTGLKPAVFLTTEYEGTLRNTDGEMGDLRFRSLAELQEMDKAMFQPFADAIDLMLQIIGPDHFDGGPGSGNWGHESVPGIRGGSKGGGGKQNRQGNAEKGYTSAAKEKGKESNSKETAKKGYEKEKDDFSQKLKDKRKELLNKSDLTEDEYNLITKTKQDLMSGTDLKGAKLSDAVSNVLDMEPDFVNEVLNIEKQLGDYEIREGPEYNPKYEGYQAISEKSSSIIDKEPLYPKKDSALREMINPENNPRDGNCQKCAITAEMMMRGYECAISDGDSEVLSWKSEIEKCFDSEGVDVSEKWSSPTNKFASTMKGFGEGARAIVLAQYESSGHAFNAYVKGGTVYVLDGQSGFRCSYKQSGNNRELDNLLGKSATIIRTDNAKMTKQVEKYVRK